jgi:hypothetical protein
VSTVVEFVFAIMLPTAAVFALIGAWRAAGWLGDARSRARFKALPPEPIERLEADLRRLRAELEDTETRTSLTAKHHRVQADISPPHGGDRATQAEIYRVEAALRERGLDVRREAAAH